MKFIDVFETLCDKSQHMVSLHLTKGDGGRDVYFTYFHQVNLHDNNWRKTVRQRERGYKALFHAQSIMVPTFIGRRISMGAVPYCLKIYSNEYLQKRMIQKKDFMKINNMKGLLII